MSNPDPKIQDIRKRHKSATPGPWKLVVDCNEHFAASNGIGIMSFGGDMGYNEFKGSPPNAENTDFIELSHNDISYLLSEYERMKEALEWYADKRNYEEISDGFIPVEKDDGEKASRALSHLKGE